MSRLRHGSPGVALPLAFQDQATFVGGDVTELVSNKASATPSTCGSSCADREGDLERFLVSGGDDRTTIDASTGTNSYHCEPRPTPAGDVSRSSCTCSPPTAEGFAAARALLEHCFAGSISGEGDDSLASEVSRVHEEHRTQLAELLRLPEGTEVVFCPSGSDAEYVPLVIANILAPGRHIRNIVTQNRETGSGTGSAASGRFFTKLTPLAGECIGRQKGSPVAGLADAVNTMTVQARHRDGTPVDMVEKISGLLQEAEQAGEYVITHRVVCGKTGLQDAHIPKTLGDGSAGLAVIDACQLRSRIGDLSEWLEGGAVVLLTGSKFYQGPPFSGCVLVPQSVARSLAAATATGDQAFTPSPDYSEGLGAFFSRNELPPCLSILANRLHAKPNVGLALRWRAALANMAPLLSRFPCDDVREAAIKSWEAAVQSLVQEIGRGLLDAWSAQSGIVSIRVRRRAACAADGAATEQAGGEAGIWHGVSDLRQIFGWCARDASGLLPAEAPEEDTLLCSRRCFLGQPVDVADTFAVLRIALGARDLRRWLSEELENIQDSHSARSAVLEEDRTCLRKLALMAWNYDAMASAEAERSCSESSATGSSSTHLG